MSTGELADAIHRDLITDRLAFDELGWRGLWAYVTKAPPGTAIFHERLEGWTVADRLAVEYAASQLDDVRELLWRYTAVHFERGKDMPFPRPVPRPWLNESVPEPPKALTLEEAIPPEVRALLQGG